MCFRPADSAIGAASVTCASCGKEVKLGGMQIDKCPFCKGALTAAAPGAPGAPAAPGAPGAPAAPGAPK